jgi:hypothetical protein
LRSLADLANAHNHLGNKSKATEILGRMKSAPTDEKAINPVFANVYLALGELDLAFDFTEKSIENKEGLILFYLHVHRHTAGVSGDPRFRKYLERLGLPY